jgi:serine/threonine protein phosphatase PrpC
MDGTSPPATAIEVDVGFESRTGLRARNEDFGGYITPASPLLENKGLVFALADGVSGSENGGHAAQAVVKSVLSDYYATPDTWSVKQSLDRVITAANRWLLGEGTRMAAQGGGASATTLTVLVLRGRMAYFAHVGDTRLCLERDGAWQQLTADHTWQGSDDNSVLTRAVGMDSPLAIDHGELPVAPGDRFLLLCDGIWAALSQKRTAALLREADAMQAAACSLCDEALERGASDNVSVLSVHVRSLPAGDLRDSFAELKSLPAPPLLSAGDVLDGFFVTALRHESAVSRVYQVTDSASGRALALKTLAGAAALDENARSALAHEEWLTKRANARFFPAAFAMPATRRTALYIVSTWHEGRSLKAAIGHDQHFTFSEGLKLASALTRAAGALHRRSIIHRDLTPANVHLGADGEIRVLDLGIATSGFEPTAAHAAAAGTPTYIAPEQYAGSAASVRSDLFAVGVTIYHALTRRFPYGEIEPFQHPRFGEPTPPTRYRPDLPAWFETVLLKAVAKKPEDRFETAEEMLLALERGASHAISRPEAAPMVDRIDVALWQRIAMVSVVVNLLLLVVLLARYA